MAVLYSMSSVLFITLLINPIVFASPINDTDTRDVTADDALQSKGKMFSYYMNNLCGGVVKLSSTKAVRVFPWEGNHPPSQKDCQVSLQSWAYQNYQLVITFKDMELSYPTHTSGDCDIARLDLYSGTGTPTSAMLNGMKGLCGRSVKPDQFTTSHSWLTLRFRTYNLAPNQYESFEAVVTPFHYGRCDHSEHKCSNGRCILEDLVCDGNNNCGDDSDEKGCAKFALSVAAIIGIVIGSIAFVSIAITVFVCCCFCACCSAYESI